MNICIVLLIGLGLGCLPDRRDRLVHHDHRDHDHGPKQPLQQRVVSCSQAMNELFSSQTIFLLGRCFRTRSVINKQRVKWERLG